MQKAGAADPQNENGAVFMFDRPRMERAIAELVRFAAVVGVGGGDLVQMLDSGMGMSEIIGVLEAKSKQQVH
jgi:hypothetical protein